MQKHKNALWRNMRLTESEKNSEYATDPHPGFL